MFTNFDITASATRDIYTNPVYPSDITHDFEDLLFSCQQEIFVILFTLTILFLLSKPMHSLYVTNVNHIF